MSLIRFKTEQEWLEARVKYITSTEVASLFGLGEYKGAWQLWHEKIGDYSETVTGERPKWGLRMEDSIAEGVALDHGWIIDTQKYKNCIFVPYVEINLASSIDRIATCPKRGEGLIECKVVSFGVWSGEFSLSDNIIPARYEFQLQNEMLCTGLKWAVLACFVDGVAHCFIRQADPEIHALILKKTKLFWASVKSGNEPKPDFMNELDQEAIFKFFGKKKVKEEVDLSLDNHLPELCSRYRESTAEVKMAELRRDALKAEIMMKVGDAEKVTTADGYSIRCSIVEGKEVSYIRSPYRDFRIFKKEKPATKTKKRGK